MRRIFRNRIPNFHITTFMRPFLCQLAFTFICILRIYDRLSIVLTTPVDWSSHSTGHSAWAVYRQQTDKKTLYPNNQTTEPAITSTGPISISRTSHAQMSPILHTVRLLNRAIVAFNHKCDYIAASVRMTLSPSSSAIVHPIPPDKWE